MIETQSTSKHLILTINTGSSSLKSAVFSLGLEEPHLLDTFSVDRIGSLHGGFSDFNSAVSGLINDLETSHPHADIGAVGHRIVLGGAHHSAPEVVSDALLADLYKLIPVDPEHLPQAVTAIEAIAERFPGIPQVACFDSHFHASMPVQSRLLPLPRWLADEGVRRFGFHGLSYESIMVQLERIDPVAAQGKVVIAHLGAGASMVAVSEGKGVDTTMGFTPTGGLVMGTRPGDLDPGLMLYLLQVRNLPPVAINRLLNRESGLLGVSGTSQDVRDLLAAEASDERARDALALFCHIAKKHLAGMIAVLGGVDSLIFTGGIGEHAAPIRGRIVAGLKFMGIEIDPRRNDAGESIVSSDRSRVTVRVMPTDEALTIARHTAALIQF